MKKIDELLKRVEYFERLAVYGDRSSFLKSLAQNSTPVYPLSNEETNPGVAPYLPQPEQPEKLDDQKRRLLMQAQRLLQNAGAKSDAVGNAIIFGKIDWNAIAREMMAIGVSPLSDEYKQLQTIKGQLFPAAPAGQAPAQQPQGYPPIDKKQQEALSYFVTMNRIGIPLSPIDGKLGPDTRRALEAAKKFLKDQGKAVNSDSQVLLAVTDEAAKMKSKNQVA